MAFPATPGYGNLPNGSFAPVIYSQKVLKFLRKVSVAEDITNTDYFGEINAFGDTVKIIKEPVITVSDYYRGATVVPQDIVDEDITLTIDRAKAFSFKTDDIEAKHSHVNWLDLATSSAAYSVKDSYDSHVLDYMVDEALADGTNTYGADASEIDVGFATSEISPLSFMNRLARNLDLQNVPTDNRWFVAGPYFWEQMAEDSSKLIGVDFTGDSSSILRNGLVTKGLIRGFKCYTSNNMPTSTGGYTALAGHMSSTATATQIQTVEKLRDQNSFGDIVRGLHLYGRKVLRPKCLALGYYKVD